MELLPAHGLVGLAVVGTVLVHQGWMSMRVGKARKQYGITYPTMYAPAGHKHENAFNCVQRAHQNSLEGLASHYALLLTAGAKYPISASVCCAIVLLGRIMYFNGYASGDPKGRMRGAFHHIGELGLMGMVARWSLALLAPSLGF